MKIAFDVHKTIDKSPDVFRLMMTMAIEVGHEVWVISGPPKNDVITELSQLRIYKNYQYNKLETIVNYLKNNEVDMTQDENGDWWTDEIVWNRAKAEICCKNQIDILIDDKKEYAKYFEYPHRTRFILY